MADFRRFSEFHTPKAGSSEQEYEDASACRIDGDAGFARVAIADGATESFRSGRWARYLAESFVKDDFGTWRGENWINRARSEFEQKNDYSSLPWHSIVKAANGAHATFMGLELNLNARTFRTFSVGDCCLLVRGRKTLVFPRKMSRVPDFGFTPDLVSTRNPHLPYPRKTRERSFGTDEAEFWLMTDALAEVVLNLAGFNPVRAADILRSLHDQAAFTQFITELRSSRQMKNDDVTLVHLIVGKRTDPR